MVELLVSLEARYPAARVLVLARLSQGPSTFFGTIFISLWRHFDVSGA